MNPGDSIHFNFVTAFGESLDALIQNVMAAEGLCGLLGVAERDPEEIRSNAFLLQQNYPNPFFRSTTIRYTLPRVSEQNPVRLAVYDITGRLVETLVEESQEPGFYSVQWEGKGRASGIYFYHLKSDKFTTTGKLILLK